MLTDMGLLASDAGRFFHYWTVSNQHYCATFGPNWDSDLSIMVGREGMRRFTVLFLAGVKNMCYTHSLITGVNCLVI